ncbi:MAG: PSD1 and planctomycete cytochrome C domain-containing protein [Pirellulaceae bacterium]|nr:PSD1 and planctomycete cytochrome C domain-containing protein [Pirellulaceae bacterium]
MLIFPAHIGRIGTGRSMSRQRFGSTWLLKLPLAVVAVCLVTWSCGILVGQEASVEHYLTKIKPILHERCFSCHGALQQEADLRLDTAAAMVGKTGRIPVVLAKQPNDSELVVRLRHEDPGMRMPPEGRALSEDEIHAIVQWIQDGANAPNDEQPQADPLSHWAFQGPQRDPTSQYTENTHPIDRLLASSKGRPELESLPRAEAVTLVRRVYLDLLGIPPTKSEVERFVANDSPEAYANLIDELLARPEYGQRWGRHWMDVWRYSDWYGRRSVPDVMNSYPQIWRWRDWIVRSLNEDKGYDRMVMEMLAADELAPNDPANTVATGFLVRNWYKWNYETWMKDNVEHTARAFLGLSLHCAHCHDHKYDPITHEDYFRFRAFFEPLELRHDRVAGEPDPGPFQKYVYALSYGPIASGAIRVFDEKLDAETYMYTSGDARNRILGRDPVGPGPPTSFQWSEFSFAPITLPAEAAYPGLQAFVREEETRAVDARRIVAEKHVAESHAAVLAAEDEWSQARQAASAAGTVGVNEAAPDLLLAAEIRLTAARLEHDVAEVALRLAQAAVDTLAARIAADEARYRSFANPEQLAKHAHRSEKRLAYQTAYHAQQVARQQLQLAQQQWLIASEESAAAAQQAIVAAQQAFDAAAAATTLAQGALAAHGTDYAPLSPQYPSTSTGRRSALARWIVDRQNPLTARVAVNHIWLRHFGQALVETPDNFGLNGKAPRHPQLLDWLAIELMDNHWSMKHLHRVIMTSAAYQRSSHVPQDHPGLTHDGENVHYWRRRPTRMEAEVVRDSVLSSAALIDTSQGGTDIDVSQWHESTRRSMYFTIHGEAEMTFLNTFDGPSVGECYRRISTVLPQQALALTNSELVLKFGRHLATQISTELNERDSVMDEPTQNPTHPNERFVREVFWRVLNRGPSPAELELSLEFLSSQTERFSALTNAELVGTPVAGIPPAATDPELRARENLTCSLFSHNDFLTIR